MGKKSKVRYEEQNCAENSGSCELTANVNKKAKKRKSTVNTSHIENSITTENSNENENEIVKNIKSKKKNNEHSQELKTEEQQSLKKSKDRQAKHTKNETSTNHHTEKPKKIIFIDDKTQAVPETSGTTGDTTKKTKKFLNNDELAVKDEEIDQFCDELDEKDDEVFQEWVKLIEANLNPNKKKAK